MDGTGFAGVRGHARSHIDRDTGPLPLWAAGLRGICGSGQAREEGYALFRYIRVVSRYTGNPETTINNAA